MTNDEVIKAFVDHEVHKGAHQASNPKGSLSYIDDTLYSYNSILATFDRRNRAILVNKDIANYSVTSAKHAAKLKSFWVDSVFYILDNAGVTPIDKYLVEIIETMEKYTRARSNKEYIHDTLEYIFRAYSDAIPYFLSGSKKRTAKKRMEKLKQAFANYTLWDIPYSQTVNLTKLKEKLCKT